MHFFEFIKNMSNSVKCTNLPVYFPLLPQKSVTTVPWPSWPSGVTQWWQSPGCSARCDEFVPRWLNPQSLDHKDHISAGGNNLFLLIVWCGPVTLDDFTALGQEQYWLYYIGGEPSWLGFDPPSCNNLCWLNLSWPYVIHKKTKPEVSFPLYMWGIRITAFWFPYLVLIIIS